MTGRFRASAQCRTPRPDVREWFPTRSIRGGHSAGSAIHIGNALRSARAHSPAIEVQMFESAASSPICPDQAIQSRLLRSPARTHARAQFLEILNVLNWPEVVSSGSVPTA